jgi:hypothetical protein
MRSKSEKVYTLAQVAKMLRKGTTTVYNYANGGLIALVPGKVSVSGRPIKAVSEAEFARLKRDGVDPTGLKDALSKRGGVGKSAKKKQVKRGAVGAAAKSAAKKRVKRGAAAAAAKKKVGRGAAAVVGKAAKKQTRRGKR